jgi:hypothetical protein
MPHGEIRNLRHRVCFVPEQSDAGLVSPGEKAMARRYSKKSQNEVRKAMRERKHGTLRSGRSGKKVTSRKQAIAIGLSKARKKGARVPAKT